MKWPAVWIAKEGSFEVTDSPLTSSSWVAYRNRFFDGLRFYDSAGDTWVVTRAELSRPPRILDRLLNRTLDVLVHFSGPDPRPLAETAELLCRCVDRDPDDLYSQYIEPQELKSLFRAAATPAELIRCARTLGDPSVGDEPA